MSGVAGPRRVATAARNRRDLHFRRIATNPPFRVQLWALLNWLAAEATAAPSDERERLLANLRVFAEAMNSRRQEGTRSQ